ncbi:MAG: hypothetical protein AAF296_01085 [Pseudomonadota bacterium]
MTNKLLGLIGALLVLGILIAVVFNPTANRGSGAMQADLWDNPILPTDYSNASSQLSMTFRSGALFPRPPAAESEPAARTATPQQVEEQTVEFPRVVSISKVDGEFKASLQHQGNDIISYASGEEPVEGWTILSISSDALTVLFEGREQTIPLFEIDS